MNCVTVGREKPVNCFFDGGIDRTSDLDVRKSSGFAQICACLANFYVVAEITAAVTLRVAAITCGRSCDKANERSRRAKAGNQRSATGH